MELVKQENQNLAPADQEKRALVLSENWGVKSSQMFPMSTTKAMHSKTPSLAAIRRFSGGEAAFATVGAMVSEVAAFVNVGKTIKTEQVPMTVHLILKDYYFLKVADIKLCFMNGLSGKYGQLFDRLDGQTLLLWLAEYKNERDEIASLAAINNHDAAQNEKWAPEAIENMTALHNKWKAIHKAKEKERKYWPRNRAFKEAGITEEQFNKLLSIFEKNAMLEKFTNDFLKDCEAQDQDPKSVFAWAMMTKTRHEFNKSGGLDILEHYKNM